MNYPKQLYGQSAAACPVAELCFVAFLYSHSQNQTVNHPGWHSQQTASIDPHQSPFLFMLPCGRFGA
jgi:hypothetical protein